jgi:hypothetical protein
LRQTPLNSSARTDDFESLHAGKTALLNPGFLIHGKQSRTHIPGNPEISAGATGLNFKIFLKIELGFASVLNKLFH